MKFSKGEVYKFQSFILRWWKRNKRDLPWRHTHDPYLILVSEIMLQQTQVFRVIAKYLEFIGRYPTVIDLANATLSDVIRIWKGLGYNRRALNLYSAGKMVVEKFGGVFPKTEEQLCSLPGVGLYTARAVLVFAMKRDVAMVDTNIRRIITHHFFGDIPQSPRIIQAAADALVPKAKSWEWHQALMDYGALAMPRNRNRKQFTNTIPFKDTPRFIRGRIIDLLRDGNMRQSNLIQKCSENSKKSEDFIAEQINALIREQMISKTGGVLRLG
jgi:A/G-specific adenine glycosylase